MLENKTYPLSGANRDAKSHNEQLQRFFLLIYYFLSLLQKDFFPNDPNRFSCAVDQPPIWKGLQK